MRLEVGSAIMNDQRLTVIQLLILFVGAAVLVDYTLVASSIVSISKRDAWISVLSGSVIFVLAIPLTLACIRMFQGQGWRVWIQRRFGKAATWLLAVPLVLYLFGAVLVTIKGACYWTRSAYLPQTPSWTIAALHILLAYAAARSGIRAIAICAGIFFPISIALYLFLTCFGMQRADHHYLFPMLEQGFAPLTDGSILSASTFAEIFILLLLVQHLKGVLHTRHLLLIAASLIVALLIPLLMSIMQFGPSEASQQLYLDFELWRLVEIGRYIEHIDFLSVYQWVTGAFIRSSLCLFIIADLIPKERSVMRNVLLIGTSCLLFIFNILPLSEVAFSSWLTAYFYPLSFYLIVIWLLALWILGRIGQRQRRLPS